MMHKETMPIEGWAGNEPGARFNRPSSVHVYKALDLGSCYGVSYASMPSGPEDKETLVAALLKGLVPRPFVSIVSGSPPAFRLFSDLLGRPLLHFGRTLQPSVSFSRREDRTWAAVSVKAKVGIDAASPEEFKDPYPFSRVFRGNEWAEASEFCRGDSMEAAALLWSLKEAAVKALGRGFHDLDPLDVIAGPPQPVDRGWRFRVIAGSTPLSAWSSREHEPWVSIAFWEDEP